MDLTTDKLFTSFRTLCARIIALCGLSCVLLLGACSQSQKNGVPSPSEQTGLLSQQDATTTDSQVADLTDDALTAPAEPTLTILSYPGSLQLSWQTTGTQTKARVYQFNASTREEVLIGEYDALNTQSLTLPSHTHQRAWYQEQFRVELCHQNDCVSSSRVAITGLAEQTVQRLTPSVFIHGERYGEQVAINQDATLLVAALPVEGAIDFYLRSTNNWVIGQRTRLSSLTTSLTRKMSFALSASGDTLAIVCTDTQNPSNNEVRILERLGEGWFETAQWALEIPAHRLNNPEDSVETFIHATISDKGDRLLIQAHGKTTFHQLEALGWSVAVTLRHTEFSTRSLAFSRQFAEKAYRLSVTTDAQLKSVFTIDSLDQELWLSVWQQENEDPVSGLWLKTAAYPIDNLNPNRKVIVHSNREGSSLAVAGWERTVSSFHTPVMWRFNRPDIDSATAEFTSTTTLSASDSLRMPPTTANSAQLRFSANQSLDTVVLGWQSTQSIDENSGHDAAVSTYRFDPVNQRWLLALELPESMPTLAKHAFANGTVISPDGSTLIIATPAGQSQSGVNRVGELLVMQ